MNNMGQDGGLLNSTRLKRELSESGMILNDCSSLENLPFMQL